MSDATRVLADCVVGERIRQDELWGADFTGRDPSLWLAILLEEVGEVAEETNPDRLIVELIQVAAVALSWAEHVSTQGPHHQTPEGSALHLAAMSLGDRGRFMAESQEAGR